MLFRKFAVPERKELTQNNRTASETEVLEFVTELFVQGHFNLPRTALEVFNHCTEKFGFPLQPHYVIDALAFYTGKRKAPRIITKKNGSARTVYVEE